jgi:hypothetical protein
LRSYRSISGVLPAKIEFSNCLKVKSELCSPHSFYQFKHNLSKEEVGYLRFIRILKIAGSVIQSLSDARCPSLLLSLSLENVFLPLLCDFYDLFVLFWINSNNNP